MKRTFVGWLVHLLGGTSVHMSIGQSSFPQRVISFTSMMLLLEVSIGNAEKLYVFFSVSM